MPPVPDSSLPDSHHPGTPDPLLTANLYCEGLLDELIRNVVFPFWSEVRRTQADRQACLWMVRYGRGGEHLKLRLHAPAGQGPALRERLEEMAGRYLDGLGPAGESREGRARPDIPPIDAEDHTDGAHPDRTLLWTEYRRSHVSLPAGPYLLDDGFLARFTRCLGEACERALIALGGPDAPPATTKARQTALLKGLISGLAALGFPLAECASYLAYHRDWLVRFTLQRNEADPGKAGEILGYFDQQADKMGAAVESLRKVVRGEWTGEPRAEASDPWQRSLAGLMAWAAPRRDDPEYGIDPFAADPAFAPVFKVFHGFANALGLLPMEEGYTHHLLLRATGVQEAADGLAAARLSRA